MYLSRQWHAWKIDEIFCCLDWRIERKYENRKFIKEINETPENLS
jgi:hypothetical protein